jgi:hypothetical protein
MASANSARSFLQVGNSVAIEAYAVAAIWLERLNDSSSVWAPAGAAYRNSICLRNADSTGLAKVRLSLVQLSSAPLDSGVRIGSDLSRVLRHSSNPAVTARGIGRETRSAAAMYHFHGLPALAEPLLIS